MNTNVAKVLVSALILLNDKPRFGPRNRRLNIDSYSVAADIAIVLKLHGIDWQDPAYQPAENE